LEKIVNTFSYIFHPLFIALYATLLFFIFTDITFYPAEIFLYLIQILIITILIPISVFYLLMSMGKINSFQDVSLHQRKFPLLLNAILLYILIGKSFTLENIPELYFCFFGAIISSLVALLLIFFKIKASIHMLGISGLTGFLVMVSIYTQQDLLYTISCFLIFNGLVATSRLLLRAHTIPELILGWCIGIVPQIVLGMIWL
jgi:hypothetical protein